MKIRYLLAFSLAAVILLGGGVSGVSSAQTLNIADLEAQIAALRTQVDQLWQAIEVLQTRFKSDAAVAAPSSQALVVSSAVATSSKSSASQTPLPAAGAVQLPAPVSASAPTQTRLYPDGAPCTSGASFDYLTGEKCLRPSVEEYSGQSCFGLSHNLRQGDDDPKKNAEVSRIQQFLKEEGFFGFDRITGYFGPLTTAAVKKFQANYGVSDDNPGEIGPKTRERIEAVYCQRFVNRGDDFSATAGARVNPLSTEVSAPAIVKVLSPNGGEIWQISKSYEVAYGAAGLGANDLIFIYLDRYHSPTGEKSGQINSSLLIGVTKDKNRFNYFAPASFSAWFETGDTYKIRICQAGYCQLGSAKSDSSDSYFTIVAPSAES